MAVPLAAEDCWHLAEQLRLRISQLDTPHMTISIGKGAAVEALVAWLKGPGQHIIKEAGYALPQ
ncbi:molybdate ABC transporter periplasmic molybdate-binding protein [Aeromonas salmonicida]|nr:molybdate ABC transporter periplasmic molybdate-binding protein [Aeromonas salmonicida]